MRRPLFAVCLCFVVIAALRLWLCHSSGSDIGWKSDPFAWTDGETDEGISVTSGEETVTVTGRVYQRDTQTFSLKKVSVDVDSSDNFSTKIIGSDNSGVAGSQQNFSEQDNNSEENSQMQSEIRNMIDLDNFTQLPGKWICEYAEGQENVKIGSIVAAQGKLRPFQSATNPGEFDTAKYYDTIGVSGKLVDVKVIASGKKYFCVREELYRMKCYFQERLYKVFPEKEASILTAMLLGDKADLDAEVKNLYKRNGIIHILSISGLHITVVGMGLYRLLRKAGLPIWVSAFMGGVVLLLYGMMTGMAISACRAIGMYVIRMLGEAAGRTYDMLTALGVMAVILVWQNSMYLMHAGFLLSFASILGISVLYSGLSKIWEIQMKNKLLQSLLSGISITLFTLPIQLWFYYEVPTYAILLNLVVLPFVSFVMAAGLIVMLVPGMGILGTISCVILRSYEILCAEADRLPFHTWNPGKPAAWQVVGYYMVLLAVCGIAEWKKQEECKNSGMVAATLIIVAVLLLGFRVGRGSTVTFLDVGQGDCILVETDSGEVYLFDCGSSSRKKVGQHVLIPYLKYHGIHRIDAVFVSHSDEDHISGIRELLELGEQEGIIVEQLVLPGIAMEEREEQFSDLLNLTREKFNKSEWNEQSRQLTLQNPMISYIQAGDRFEGAGFFLTCLHPPGSYQIVDSNAYSECLYIEFAEGASLLLTGDVEGEGEELLQQELERKGIMDITILKVAHHGSENSTGKELLERIQPSVSIISCGRNNHYGHPHKALLERLEECGTQIFKTAKSGAITVKIKGNVIQIKEFS